MISINCATGFCRLGFVNLHSGRASREISTHTQVTATPTYLLGRREGRRLDSKVINLTELVLPDSQL